MDGKLKPKKKHFRRNAHALVSHALFFHRHYICISRQLHVPLPPSHSAQFNLDCYMHNETLLNFSPNWRSSWIIRMCGWYCFCFSLAAAASIRTSKWTQYIIFFTMCCMKLWKTPTNLSANNVVIFMNPVKVVVLIHATQESSTIYRRFRIYF